LRSRKVPAFSSKSLAISCAKGTSTACNGHNAGSAQHVPGIAQLYAASTARVSPGVQVRPGGRLARRSAPAAPLPLAWRRKSSPRSSGIPRGGVRRHSTVTLLARLRGLSTSQPRSTAM
jgi:hypothetical protein